MKWSGTAEFNEMNAFVAEEIRVAAARACYESAKEQRQRALDNFFVYGIGMITGRSRSLYAISLGEGMLTPGATRVSVDVGYNSWPETDVHSPDEIIAFYPWFLNYGTVHMKSRPFHTAAVDVQEPDFYARAAEAMQKAYAKAHAKWKEPA